MFGQRMCRCCTVRPATEYGNSIAEVRCTPSSRPQRNAANTLARSRTDSGRPLGQVDAGTPTRPGRAGRRRTAPAPRPGPVAGSVQVDGAQLLAVHRRVPRPCLALHPVAAASSSHGMSAWTGHLPVQRLLAAAAAPWPTSGTRVVTAGGISGRYRRSVVQARRLLLAGRGRTAAQWRSAVRSAPRPGPPDVRRPGAVPRGGPHGWWRWPTAGVRRPPGWSWPRARPGPPRPVPREWPPDRACRRRPVDGWCACAAGRAGRGCLAGRAGRAGRWAWRRECGPGSGQCWASELATGWRPGCWLGSAQRPGVWLAVAVGVGVGPDGDVLGVADRAGAGDGRCLTVRAGRGVGVVADPAGLPASYWYRLYCRIRLISLAP